jgi:CHASE1-domain containing sensor protein
MQWLPLALAIYGALLSTTLGYLAWRKDRRSIRFFVSITAARAGRDW